MTLAPTVDLDEIADATEGFSGADLQALVYNANLEVVHSTISMDISGDNSSREDETPIEYTSFGGSKDKAVSSKAEKTALQKRVSGRGLSYDGRGEFQCIAAANSSILSDQQSDSKR